MKKMLIIMPSMFIGGAERSLLGLLDNLDYDKYTVDLFLYRHEGEFLSLVPEKVNILPPVLKYSTFDVPIKHLLKSKYFIFGIARILGKIAKKIHCLITKEKSGVWMSMQYTSKYLQPLLPKILGEYDIAISFLGVPDVLVNKVNSKVKLAWNHTDYSILGPNKKYDIHIYNNVDYIISVSDKCTETFSDIYPEFKNKAITIENVLSLSLIKKQANETISDMISDSEELKLLSIGRYSYAKNFDNIPEICKLLRDIGANVKWFIIGYGSDENLIQKKIKEFNMQNHVILLGKKNNPYPYIKQCDIYVQPSRYEGKCVAVREAQFLNKPVVITNYATAQSQLHDGVDGIIVPMDNEGCAGGIADVIKNRDLFQRVINGTTKYDYSNKDEINKVLVLCKKSFHD